MLKGLRQIINKEWHKTNFKVGFDESSGNMTYQILYGLIFIISLILLVVGITMVIRAQRKLCIQKGKQEVTVVEKRSEYTQSGMTVVDVPVTRNQEVCVKYGKLSDSTFMVKVLYYIGFLFIIVFSITTTILMIPFIMQGLGSIFFLLVGLILYRYNAFEYINLLF